MLNLFISTYNRIDYVKESLTSLLDSFDTVLPMIHLTDDGSTDPKMKELLLGFQQEYNSIKIYLRPNNLGIPQGKLQTIKTVTDNYEEEYFLISDSDMIYKKGWIETLIAVYEETGQPIITGFNTLGNNHKTLEEKETHRIKDTVGGCNLLVNTEFYKTNPFLKPSWDWTMCDHVKSNQGYLVATKPSMVDHIGKTGVFSRPTGYDKAEDF